VQQQAAQQATLLPSTLSYGEIEAARYPRDDLPLSINSVIDGARSHLKRTAAEMAETFRDTFGAGPQDGNADEDSGDDASAISCAGTISVGAKAAPDGDNK
jgi:hypothetical protein